MKKFLLSLCLAPSLLAVPQMATFASTQYGTTTISGSPFSTQQSWRLEGRIASWSLVSLGSSYKQFDLAGSWTIFVKYDSYNNLYDLELHDDVDGLTNILGDYIIVPMPNQTGADMVWRLTKNYSAATITLETWNVNGSGYQSSYSGMSTPVSTITGTVNIADTGAAAGSLGFMRWYSTLLPIGSIAPHGGAAGDLGDWEFNGNGNDSSSYANNLTFPNGVPTYGTAPIYPPACNMPALTPSNTFQTLVSQSFLNTNLSFALNGGSTLTAQWAQINEVAPFAGQAPPSTFSFLPSNTNSSPTFTATASGSYTIQLTVTDSSSQSTTCDAKYGGVKTDSNGVVQIANATQAQIAGKIMWAGGQRYPYLVTSGLNMANLMIQKLLGTAPYQYQFIDWWNYAAAGTVTVTAGSTAITGSGTHFLNMYTGGSAGSALTVNGNLPYIIIWYPLPTSLYNPTKYGRFRTSIVSCSSDTSCTINNAYPNAGGSTSDNYILPGSGLSWSYADGWDNTGSTAVTGFTISSTAPVVSFSGSLSSTVIVGSHVQVTGTSCAALTANGGLAVTAISGSTVTLAGSTTGCTTSAGTMQGVGSVGGWELGSYPGNYYDNVFAFYNLYFCTGLDDYLYYARLMADRWFSFYNVSLGGAFGSEWQHNNGGELANQSVAPTGLYMRNADSAPYDYSPGMALIANWIKNSNGDIGYGDCRATGVTISGCINYDVRGSGASNLIVALDGLYNSNSAQKADDATAIKNEFDNRWQPSFKSTGGSAGVWDMYQYVGYSTWNNGGFTAQVTVGSPTVTPKSGSTWNCSNFASGPFSPTATPSGIWFAVLTNQAAVGYAPISNASGDSQWYYVQCNSGGTSLTLIDVNGNSVNYAAGTTCASGTCGANPLTGGTGSTAVAGWAVSGLLGFGSQPFMIGYQNSGFGFGQYLMLAAGYSTEAGYGLTDTLANGLWLGTTGLDQTTHSGYSYPTNGVYYGSRFVDCNPTAGSQFNSGACWNGSPLTQRETNGEAISGMVWAATLNPSLVSSLRPTGDLMEASLWQCTTTAPDYSGTCIAGDITGFMYSGGGQHKWWGYYWGMGRGLSWDAVRISSSSGTPGPIALPKSIALPGSIARLGPRSVNQAPCVGARFCLDLKTHFYSSQSAAICCQSRRSDFSR